MGRKQREMSNSGIYHVMLRGVNKQRIFEFSEDYQGFLRIMYQSKVTNTEGKPVEKPNFDVYAYCLMDNHVHLLLGTREVPLADVVKRIGSSYARFFNMRYKRVGHLYQDRFKSEPVDDLDYFCTLLRYIHRNPVKSGICNLPEQYQYSSYREITQRCLTPLCKNPLSDADRALICTLDKGVFGMLPDEIRDFVLMINREVEEEDFAPGSDARDMIKREYEMLSKMVDRKQIAKTELSDDERRTIMGDDEYEMVEVSTLIERFTQWCQTLLCNLKQAKKDSVDADALDRLILDTLQGLTCVDSITDFQRLDKKRMRSALAMVRDAGISIRHLSRLTGISEGIIRSCKNPELFLPSGASVVVS